MINYQGIVKPSFHAYRMLNALGDIELYKDEQLFVSRRSEDDKIVALAYNYPVGYYNAVPGGNNKRENGTSRDIELQLDNLAAGKMFRIEILDSESGNVHNYWEAMGSPEPPTREQVVELKKFAENLRTEIVSADKDGRCTIKQTLTPWSVVLIEQIN